VERSLKRKLAIGAAGIAVLGGGGAAYAVNKSNDNDRQAFLGDVAKRLNVTPDKLNSALKGAFEDRLAAAVKAGRLTQAQADKIKKQVEQNGGPPVLGPPGARGFGAGGPRLLHRFGGPGGPVHDGIDAAAKYLGLTDKQLLGKLKAGKSLADVAGDQSKSVDGLKSAIKGSVKSYLDQAVKAKKLTQAQEDKILGNLDQRLNDLVNRKGLGPRPGFRKGGPAWGAKRGGNRPGSFAVPPDAPAPPPGAPII
jgi:hypothetical protein